MAEKNECENFPIRNVYLLWAQCGRVHTPYLHTFSCSRSLICCINFAFCCHSTLRTPQAKQQKSENERFIRISIELHHICGQRNFHSCGFTGRTMRWIFIGNSSSCACWFNIHLTIAGFSTQSVNQCGMNDGTSWVPNQRFRYFFSSLFYPARPTSHGNLIIIHQIQWSAKNVPMAAILLYENWIFTFDFILFYFYLVFSFVIGEHWLNFKFDDFYQTTTVTPTTYPFRILSSTLNSISNPQKSIVSGESHHTKNPICFLNLLNAPNEIEFLFILLLEWIESHIFMIYPVGRDFALKLVII